MPSIFAKLFRIGTLPEPLRAELEPEGIVHVSEKVRVVKRFSGSVPGRHDALGVNRHIAVVVFTRRRLYTLLPTLQRLKGPAIDEPWDGPGGGPAAVQITVSAMRLDIDLPKVDPRFRGSVSLAFSMDLDDDVLAALPARSLAFAVSPEYVFHMLGVRAK